MDQPTPKSLTAADIDRLVVLSRRQPLATVAVSWSSVWVLLMFLIVIPLRGAFVVDGVIMLERVGAALVVSAVLAAAVCWLWYRFDVARVENARGTLSALAKQYRRASE